MTISEQIKATLTTAMKARNEPLLSVMRMAKTALDKAAKDQGKPLDDAGEQKVISTMLKQRRESVEMFTQGNRHDLAEKEKFEITVLETFLPVAATQEEVENAIQTVFVDFQTSGQPLNMGTAMKAVTARLQGKRVDGKLVSQLVKQALERVS